MLNKRSLLLFAVMLTQVLVLPVGSYAIDKDVPQDEAAFNHDNGTPFEWWIEPRYEASWWAYDPHTHSYDQDYVYPTGWDVGFDVCGTAMDTAGDAITYTWETTRTDIGFIQTVQVDSCRFDQNSDPKPPRLPQQGDYEISLTVAYSDRPSQTVSGQIRIKDILIVSIGDSNAAGEGNPMTNLITDNPPPDIWWDRNCHRSSFSGHAFTAARIEAADPHSSVTFLSFACSGAEILKGLVLEYEGIENPGTEYALPFSQLNSVMRHLCRATSIPYTGECADSPRQIDALFVSIGVNDLKFSRIVKSCADLDKLTDWDADDLVLPGVIDILSDFDWDKVKDRGVDILFGVIDELIFNPIEWLADFFGIEYFDCTDELNSLIDTNLLTMWLHYELFDTILDGNVDAVLEDINSDGLDDGDDHPFNWLSGDARREMVERYGGMSPEMKGILKPREVYITSYPRDIFHDENNERGGCGVLAGISENEANWIYHTGAKLNNHIALEAEKHGWYYVDGITELFDTHGYCSSSNWYVQMVESFIDQFPTIGAVHPNIPGHNATADRLYARYMEDKPSFATQYGVTITFERVRFVQSYNGQVQTPGPRNLVVRVNDRWHRHGQTLKSVEVPANDWYDFPQTDEFSYTAHLNYYEKLYVAGILNSATALIIDDSDPDTNPCDGDVCTDPLPPLEVRTERMFWGGNEYGRLTDWCVPTSTLFGRNENLCTVTVTRESLGTNLTMDLVYRINVVRLDLYLESPDEYATICIDYCDGGAAAFYPSLSQGIQVLRDMGENTQLEEAYLETMLYHTTPLVKTSQDYLRDDDRAYAVAIQPDDGKILVAGYAKTATIYRQQVALARYNAVGQLDTTFGDGGLVLAGLHDTDAGFAVATAPDGKIVVAGTRGSSDVDFAVWRFNADGTPDDTFNLLGFNVVDFGDGNDYGRAVIVQPDGKVIIAGYASDGKSNVFALARLNSNGTLDTSFGEQGRVRTGLGPGIVRVSAAAEQPDGKIVVVGRLDDDIVAVRYLPEGILDNGFGRNGIARFDFDGNQFASAIAILPNGDLALAGFADHDFGLLVVHEDGRPCTTSCGLPATYPILTADFGGDETAHDLAVQPDGKIVIAGSDRGLSADSDIYLIRYHITRTGYQIDTSFGDSGRKIIDIGSDDSARAVTIDNRSQIVVAGSSEIDGIADDFSLLRYTSGLKLYRSIPELEKSYTYLPLTLR
jgi:uncharacterized delta-60 repeat protein